MKSFIYTMMMVSGILIFTLTAMASCTRSEGTGDPKVNQDWVGNPYTVQSQDNPYVKRLQGFVERDLGNYKKNKSGKLEWLVWGYTAPESKRRGDAELKKIAFEAMDLKLSELEKAPNGNCWDVSVLLPTIFMWTRAEEVPKESIEKWLKQYRPSIELEYTYAAEKLTKGTLLINEIFQIAADLQCASKLYSDEKYSVKAKELIRLCEPYQNEDGAFDYFGHSGTNPVYFNFEAGWLGWYYQFSQDELAKKMIKKMAKVGVDMIGSGIQLPAEGLWFKTELFNGGSTTALESISGIAHDPLMRSIAEFRLASGQDHISAYLAMNFWDPTIPIVDFPSDICRYSSNTEGPKIRKGDWYVSMPNKARAATVISASYVPKKLYTTNSYLEFANILLYDKGASILPIYRGKAYFAIAEGQEFNKGIVIGEDFIAEGKTYVPSITSTSHIEPVINSWKSIQLWFADGEGFSGWLEVDAQADNGIGYVKGAVKTAKTNAVLGMTSKDFKQGQIKYTVFGEQVDKIEMADEQTFLINFKNAENKQFFKGDTYGYGLSGSPLDKELAEVKLLSHNTIFEVSIKRGENLDIILAYNPTGNSITYTNSNNNLTYYKSTKDNSKSDKSLWTGNTELAPNGLVVLFKNRGK